MTCTCTATNDFLFMIINIFLLYNFEGLWIEISGFTNRLTDVQKNASSVSSNYFSGFFHLFHTSFTVLACLFLHLRLSLLFLLYICVVISFYPINSMDSGVRRWDGRGGWRQTRTLAKIHLHGYFSIDIYCAKRITKGQMWDCKEKEVINK